MHRESVGEMNETACEMKPKELLRWAAILLFGGFGLWALADGVRDVFRSLATDEGGMRIFVAMFGLVFNGVLAGVPLAISYFTFRREYRRIVVCVAGIAAVFLLGALVMLPDRLGVWEYLAHQDHSRPPLVFIALPISLLCLYGPVYAASWFYRICLGLADRYVFREPRKGSVV